MNKYVAASTCTRKISFEVEICEYLGDHGWFYDATAYDRTRALCPAWFRQWVGTNRRKLSARPGDGSKSNCPYRVNKANNANARISSSSSTRISGIHVDNERWRKRFIPLLPRDADKHHTLSLRRVTPTQQPRADRTTF